MKIRHGAIVDNVVTNLYAKFDDDWFCNEKALVLTTTPRTTTTITLVALGDPFPGPKTLKTSAQLNELTCVNVVRVIRRELSQTR